ncbi:MAG: DUF6069 family protein, partial [Chloroflexota bacterium]|nr:DUF6069 family protein [Chloroflexota bacterium]
PQGRGDAKREVSAAATAPPRTRERERTGAVRSAPAGVASGAADERVSMRRVLRVGPLAIVAAALANAGVWAVAKAAFEIPDGFVPLSSLGPPVGITAVYLAFGLGVFALLVRFTRRPIVWFWRVATVALLLSFLTPLGARGQEGATTAGILTLEVMHVVAFAVFVPLITSRTKAS